MSELSRAKLQKILGRTWEEIKYQWLDYIPNIDQPGCAPEIHAADSTILLGYLAKMTDDKPFTVPEDIPEVRRSVMHEGLFWLHKAGNVIGASQIHIREGIKSWSVSSAYHAALFTSKAILSFLGIAVIEVPDRGIFLVDIWSEEGAKISKIRTRSYDTIKIIKVRRIEHRHVWALLQRMFTITEISAEVITFENVESLKSLAFNDFARQRNVLHYRSNWLFDDIRQLIFDPEYLSFELELTDGTALGDPDSHNFSFALAFILIRTAVRMLTDIAELSPVIKDELGLLQSWLSMDFNEPYALVKC